MLKGPLFSLLGPEIGGHNVHEIHQLKNCRNDRLLFYFFKLLTQYVLQNTHMNNKNFQKAINGPNYGTNVSYIKMKNFLYNSFPDFQSKLLNIIVWTVFFSSFTNANFIFFIASLSFLVIGPYYGTTCPHFQVLILNNFYSVFANNILLRFCSTCPTIFSFFIFHSQSFIFDNGTILWYQVSPFLNKHSG